MTWNQIDGGRLKDCSRGLVLGTRKCGDQKICSSVSAGTLNSFKNRIDKNWDHLLSCIDEANENKPRQ